MWQDCSTWLNIAAAQEESGCDFTDVNHSFSKASESAQKAGQARLQVGFDLSLHLEKGCGLRHILFCEQKRVLRRWLACQRRNGSVDADDTEAQLQELCAAKGWSPQDSEGEEDEEEEMDNSEPLDNDIILSDSGTRHSSAFGSIS